MLEEPEQIVADDTTALTTGNGITLMVIESLTEHPPIVSLTVTMYLVVSVGATLIEDEVWFPGDHKYLTVVLPTGVAEIVTLPPSQTDARLLETVTEVSPQEVGPLICLFFGTDVTVSPYFKNDKLSTVFFIELLQSTKTWFLVFVSVLPQ